MGLNWALKPLTDAPSRLATGLAKPIDRPRIEDPYLDEDSMLGKYERFGRGLNANIRGGIAGSITGVGDYLSGMTSPLSLAATAVGAAPWLRGATQATGLGRVIENIPRGISPRTLPPELVALGEEVAHNVDRFGHMKNYANAIDDIAEAGSRASGKIRMPIGGNVDVADMMAKLAAARGK